MENLIKNISKFDNDLEIDCDVKPPTTTALSFDGISKFDNDLEIDCDVKPPTTTALSFDGISKFDNDLEIDCDVKPPTTTALSFDGRSTSAAFLTKEISKSTPSSHTYEKISLSPNPTFSQYKSDGVLREDMTVTKMKLETDDPGFPCDASNNNFSPPSYEMKNRLVSSGVGNGSFTHYTNVDINKPCTKDSISNNLPTDPALISSSESDKSTVSAVPMGLFLNANFCPKSKDCGDIDIVHSNKSMPCEEHTAKDNVDPVSALIPSRPFKFSENATSETGVDHLEVAEDEKDYPKPNVTMTTLIALALKNSDDGSLELSDIYNFISKYFPYYRKRPESWKNVMDKLLRQFGLFEVCCKFNKLKYPVQAFRLNPNDCEMAGINYQLSKWCHKPPTGLVDSMTQPENLSKLISPQQHDASVKNKPSSNVQPAACIRGKPSASNFNLQNAQHIANALAQSVANSSAKGHQPSTNRNSIHLAAMGDNPSLPTKGHQPRHADSHHPYHQAFTRKSPLIVTSVRELPQLLSRIMEKRQPSSSITGHDPQSIQWHPGQPSATDHHSSSSSTISHGPTSASKAIAQQLASWKSTRARFTLSKTQEHNPSPSSSTSGNLSSSPLAKEQHQPPAFTKGHHSSFSTLKSHLNSPPTVVIRHPPPKTSDKQLSSPSNLSLKKKTIAKPLSHVSSSFTPHSKSIRRKAPVVSIVKKGIRQAASQSDFNRHTAVEGRGRGDLKRGQSELPQKLHSSKRPCPQSSENHLPVSVQQPVVAMERKYEEEKVTAEKERGKKKIVESIINSPVTEELLSLEAYLASSPKELDNYTGMSEKSFDTLMDSIKYDINYPKARLLLTLRYLLTGESSGILANKFKIAVSSVRHIVYETCGALCRKLKGTALPLLSEKTFRNISDSFYKKKKYPHCLGVLGCRIFSVNFPRPSDSLKSGFIALQGVVDSDGNFISVDVVEFDEKSGCDFNKSEFAMALKKNKLPIPKADRMMGTGEEELDDPLPYVFVCSHKLNQMANLMWPFPPNNMPMTFRRVYNKRHYAVNDVVDTVFDAMLSKYLVLQRTFSVNIDHASLVLLSCCILHNFVNAREGVVRDSLAARPTWTLPLKSKKKYFFSKWLGNAKAIKTREEFAHLFNKNLFIPATNFNLDKILGPKSVYSEQFRAKADQQSPPL